MCDGRGAGGSREGGFGKILQKLEGEKEEDTLHCLWRVPVFGMLVPAVSFGRDVVMMRGAEAGTWPPAFVIKRAGRGEQGFWDAWGVGLKLLKDGEEDPVTWLHRPPVAPLGFLEGKAMEEGRRRLLCLPSGVPVGIFVKCLKGKNNVITA